MVKNRIIKNRNATGALIFEDASGTEVMRVDDGTGKVKVTGGFDGTSGLATATDAGLMGTGAQTFAGDKEFSGAIKATGGFDGSAGLATAVTSGLMGTGAQTLAGNKTFNGFLQCDKIQSGTFSWSPSSGTVYIQPANTTYMVFVQPRNFGGGDNRGGTFIVSRFAGSSAITTTLQSIFSTVTCNAATGAVTITSGPGNPSHIISWIKLVSF